MRRPRSNFRVRLEGPNGLGDLTVREVASFLNAIVEIVAKGAEELVSTPVATTGRHVAPVEQASKIRLTSLRSGSLVAGIATAKADQPAGAFQFQDRTLSESALLKVMDTVGSDEEAAEHPRVAMGIVEAYEHSASRFPDAQIVIDDIRRHRSVTVDRARSQQLRRVAARSSLVGVAGRELTGRLFEADFERRIAHVRTPDNAVVEVRFDAIHDDDIHRYLRSRATIIADVTFDPATGRIKRLQVREVLAGSQLGLDFGGVDFWRDPDLHQLVAAVGGRPVTDLRALQMTGVSDEEWASLYAVVESGS
jgi:hypothetical protein